MGVDVPRVLIADSDSALRMQLYGALLNCGVFSDLASSTNEALTALAEHEYGVVVVDVSLPTGDVDRVIARIESMPATDRPVVLVLAANPESARSLDVEIVQIVLRRPVHLTQLTDVVCSCLRSHTRAREAAGAPRHDGYTR